MNIVSIYKEFPTTNDCLKHLEKIRWNNQPTCPYCESQNQTPLLKEHRYHCNNCNTSFSVTVGTIFHNTKLDLQKWFLAISLVLNAKKGISARQLARDIEVNKDTAWYMLMRLRKAMVQDSKLLKGIVEADETYIGGKEKNKHLKKRIKGTQGRSTKTKISVVGTIERNGNVKAEKSKDVKGKTLKRIINQSVEKGSRLITDDWRGYRTISSDYDHAIIFHSASEYVRDDIHTNSIESFWALLKRGVIGQYHHVTDKYLNKYLDEFCFRFNNRNNLSLFELTIERSLGVIN